MSIESFTPCAASYCCDSSFRPVAYKFAYPVYVLSIETSSEYFICVTNCWDEAGDHLYVEVIQSVVHYSIIGKIWNPSEVQVQPSAAQKTELISCYVPPSEGHATIFSLQGIEANILSLLRFSTGGQQYDT